jgi:hypothetical protein
LVNLHIFLSWKKNRGVFNLRLVADSFLCFAVTIKVNLVDWATTVIRGEQVMAK